MAANPAPSKTSTSPRTTREIPSEGPNRQNRPARAHRNDTPEAKLQRSRAPKTHPKTRNTGAVRKDESGENPAK
jgi:hypothetical protein